MSETFRIKPGTTYQVHYTKEPELPLQDAKDATGRKFYTKDIITRTARHIVLFAGSYVVYLRHEDIDESK